MRNCISSRTLEMGIGSSKVRHSFSADWGRIKPCKSMCRVFALLEGAVLGGHMQTIPNPAELTLHVRLKTQGSSGRFMPEDEKRRDHAKAAVLLDNATSPVAI